MKICVRITRREVEWIRKYYDLEWNDDGTNGRETWKIKGDGFTIRCLKDYYVEEHVKDTHWKNNITVQGHWMSSWFIVFYSQKRFEETLRELKTHNVLNNNNHRKVKWYF